MVKALPEPHEMSITTNSGSYHQIASRAVAAQQLNNKLLSVAEQGRRNSMCCLTKAVVDSDILGEIY